MKVTKKVLKKFMNRSNETNEFRARNNLSKMIKEAVPIDMKAQAKLTRLLNNKCKIANYYKYGGWILVESGGLLRTVYENNCNWFQEAK